MALKGKKKKERAMRILITAKNRKACCRLANLSDEADSLRRING